MAERIASERDRVDSTRRRQSQRVQALIGGGEPAFRAADDLRLAGPLTVVAVGTVAGPLPAGGLVASLSLYLDTLAVDAVAAQLSETIYLVIATDETNARRLSADFLTRARGREFLAVAVGRTVKSASESHLSRSDTDHVLGALRHGRSGGTVAGMRDTLASVLALHVADIIDGLGDSTPLGSSNVTTLSTAAIWSRRQRPFSSTAVTWRILLPHCMFTPQHAPQPPASRQGDVRRRPDRRRHPLDSDAAVQTRSLSRRGGALCESTTR